MDMQGCIITTTTRDAKEADRLAQISTEAGLAACVQVIPGIRSYYLWQGKFEKSEEYLLQFKTLRKHVDELMAFISREHTYDTPEIIVTSIEKMDKNYANWLHSVLNPEIS